MVNMRQFVAENIYAKCFRSPHWRVGWRRLAGPDLWDTQSLQKTSWHLLPDPRIMRPETANVLIEKMKAA